MPLRKDTINFKEALYQRLFEGGFIADDSLLVDSVKLAKAIKTFQQSKGITADGKIGDETIRMLNTSDRESFVRIAITLDKYKMLPDSMPCASYMGQFAGLLYEADPGRFGAAVFKNYLWQRDHPNPIAHQRYFQYGNLSTMDHTGKYYRERSIAGG